MGNLYYSRIITENTASSFIWRSLNFNLTQPKKTAAHWGNKSDFFFTNNLISDLSKQLRLCAEYVKVTQLNGWFKQMSMPWKLAAFLRKYKALIEKSKIFYL